MGSYLERWKQVFIRKVCHVHSNFENFEVPAISPSHTKTLFYFVQSSITWLYALQKYLSESEFLMAKCSGCGKDVGDNYVTYHRSKCEKAKALLQNALSLHAKRPRKRKTRFITTETAKIIKPSTSTCPRGPSGDNLERTQVGMFIQFTLTKADYMRSKNYRTALMSSLQLI